jgi:hypothetical protein
MTMSEEQENKQKHAGMHTKQFQVLTVPMSADTLLAKTN